MGAVQNAFETYGNSFQPAPEWVDFDAVRDAALINAETVATHYLPNGRRDGDEWSALNPTRPDSSIGSLRYNVVKGIWRDFATGDGGDAIDLVVYIDGKSPLDAARDLASLLIVAPGKPAARAARPRPAPQPKASICATVDQWRISPASFPARTEPDADGKPRFMSAGDEGPRVFGGEKRRHAYCVGGVPVRYKILGKEIRDDKQAYRVTSSEGETGWQYRKPAGFMTVPYVAAGSDPFASSDPLFWPEGEKDVDTVARIGLDAFAFGGTGDGLPAGCEQYVVGRNLVILADNDDAGRDHAEKKATAAHYGVAARVYLAALVANLHNLQKQVAVISKSFCSAYVPAGADGQIERVSVRRPHQCRRSSLLCPI